jgi:hypothetical protein
MASGGYEQDFPADTGGSITPGEALTLAWDVIDSAGVALASFVGWTTVKCYITTSRGAANGLTALNAVGGALLEITATLGAVPRITAIINDSDWSSSLNADMLARSYYYELWREDVVSGASPARLAYGKITTRD